MPIWKLSLISFGLIRLPMWVLAEGQALERPPAATPTRPAAVVIPAPDAPEVEMATGPLVTPQPSGFQRFVDRFVDAIVRYGDRSYEAKVRSGRLNRYFY